jgi:poly-gamma-glutamate synthesis protein (capsule biosynthesis protein)
MECTVPSPEDPPAFAAGQGWAGTHMRGTPQMLEDLKFLGITGVTAGNNHVSDFGDSGVLSTLRHLRAASLPYAGIGASLTAASGPGFVDTRTGLRVAFLSACDWGPRGTHGLNFPWPAGYLPSDERPPWRSRPGVNLVRYDVASQVSREELEQLREISRRLGWEKDKILRGSGFWRSHPLVGFTTNLEVEVDSDSQFYFLGRRFVAGGSAATQGTFGCPADVQRIEKAVRDARRQADLVFFALHDQSHGEHVHDFIRDLAHTCVDAGVDVFYNTGGSHMGMEIYRGKAIMYGIPNFCLQTETVTTLPSSVMERLGLSPDATAADFLEARARHTAEGLAKVGGPDKMIEAARGSAVNLCVFNDSAELTEIRVQPVEPLGGTPISADESTPVPRHRRGLPLMPDPDGPLSKRVLAHAVEVSKDLGTEVEVVDGTAVIKLR